MIRTTIPTIVLSFAFILVAPQNYGFAGGKKGDPKTYLKVEAKGKLITGIAAIGGETTGTIITTRGGTLELDFGKSKKLRELARTLNKQTVVATGYLSIRRGVEIRTRFIVDVRSLKKAK